jgi:general nucleoside transport system ATP-binding protein
VTTTIERPTAPALLSVRGSTCRFGEVLDHDSVDFDVAPGEVHPVLGENGAGKSTLMKLIDGVYQANSGELHDKAVDEAAKAVDEAGQGGAGGAGRV